MHYGSVIKTAYGLYRVEALHKETTLKVVQVVAFSEEQAIKSFCELQKTEQFPVTFEKHEDGSVRCIVDRLLIVCKCVRSYAA